MWSLVEWSDTTSIQGAWSTAEDVKNIRPTLIKTVGEIIHNDDDYVTIVGSTGTDGEYGDVNCIPRNCIVKILPFPVEQDFNRSPSDG